MSSEATVEITDSTNLKKVLLVENDDYIEFVGFKINGGWDSVKWSFSNGGLLQDCEFTGSLDRGVDIDDASTVTITDCEIHNIGAEALYVHGASTVTMSGTEIHIFPPLLSLRAQFLRIGTIRACLKCSRIWEA